LGKHRFVIDGQSFEVDVLGQPGAEVVDVTVNGQHHQVTRAPVEAVRSTAQRGGANAAGAARQASRPARPSARELRAPMAGRVLHVNVTPGRQVKAGEALLVLDAMKMENSLGAPSDGVVAEVAVAVGDTVMQGTLLVRMQA
jgi:glutaconyl-CoA/methylmalonyl-CoA decarboxylase subunit gamma